MFEKVFCLCWCSGSSLCFSSCISRCLSRCSSSGSSNCAVAVDVL